MMASYSLTRVFRLRNVAALVAAATLALPAVAADTPDPQPAAASRNPLATAGEHIAGKRWSDCMSWASAPDHPTVVTPDYHRGRSRPVAGLSARPS